jgi:hypothetical protein
VADFSTAQELVRDDVMDGLSFAFEPTGGFGLLKSFDGKELPAGAVTFVPWQFSCRHVGEFLGIEATGREATIVGATAIEYRGDSEPMFHRFIDWANVFAQLGVTMAARPIVRGPA